MAHCNRSFLPSRRVATALAVGTTLAWPIAAHAQQGGRMRRIGVLQAGATTQTVEGTVGKARLDAFKKGLVEHGWNEGRNLRIDYGGGVTEAERVKSAVELVKLAPEVIWAASTASLSIIRQATRTIPIVFSNVSDPVALGYVASLARPGGNITGFAMYEASVFGKGLQLLKEIAPGVTRVAFVHDSSNPSSLLHFSDLATAAASLGVQTSQAPVQTADDVERAISTFAREPNGGLFVVGGPSTANHRALIIALAARHRLPATYAFRYFVADGGLMSYGVDDLDPCRRAASYVDRILKGAKPTDLPVQQATKFEFVINMRTAKALGLSVSNQMQIIADEVIE